LSTIPPGIGSLSGKFIRGIGVTILRKFEDLVVIRKRIAYIQSMCPLFDDTPPDDVELIYRDLLELARCVANCRLNPEWDSDRFNFGTDLTSTLIPLKIKRYK
jgi:hypothetical protein